MRCFGVARTAPRALLAILKFKHLYFFCVWQKNARPVQYYLYDARVWYKCCLHFDNIVWHTFKVRLRWADAEHCAYEKFSNRHETSTIGTTSSASREQHRYENEYGTHTQMAVKNTFYISSITIPCAFKIEQTKMGANVCRNESIYCMTLWLLNVAVAVADDNFFHLTE